MKKVLMLFVALILVLAACGGDISKIVDNSGSCAGGPDLVVSDFTPTNIIMTAGTPTIVDFSMRISGTHCESVRATVKVQNTTYYFDGGSPADAYPLRLMNVRFDPDILSGLTGTWSALVSTSTRSYNILGTWKKQ